MALTIGDIQGRAAAHFGITVGELLNGGLARRFSRPRQVAMYLAWDLTGLSVPRIARAFGRDHTTVLAAMIRVQRLIGVDPGFAEQITALRAELSDP